MATSNTIFSNYHPNGHHINPSLLREYDMSTFDWQRSKALVAQRVVELGWPEDFYGAFDLYGGFEGFREVIKSIPHLSDIDMNFVCHYFNLQKEELLCYTRKQSRQSDSKYFREHCRLLQGDFDWKVIAHRLNEMTSHPERHFKRL